MVNKLNYRANLTLWTSLESDIRHITKYGYSLNLVRVDGEGAINLVWFETKLATVGTALDTTGAGEAVTVVERKIRQIKERVRAVINTLPFRLTEKLEGWLVRYCGPLRVCYPIQPIRCCFHLSTFVFTATTISH